MEGTDLLVELLQRREAVIADHAWRDRDSESHLRALKEVSIAISDWPAKHPEALDPKLSHYLTNASYAKALAHLQSTNTAK